MNALIKFDDVNNKIITIRNQNVILDSDVATLYGVETKEVNRAVRNNPKKFPEGYIFELSKPEWHGLRASNIANVGLSGNSSYLVKNFDQIVGNDSKSDRFGHLVENFHQTAESNRKSVDLGNRKHSYAVPKAFTEKGLYMLATILKSGRAIEATIAIVEAFAKLRELSNNLIALSAAEEEVVEPEVLQSVGGLFKDLLFSAFPQSSAETSLEVNLGIMKLKRGVKNENPVVSQDFQRRLEELERRIAGLR